MIKKVLKWVGYAAIAFVALGTVAVASGDSKAGEKAVTNRRTVTAAEAAAIAYTIADKKISGDQTDMHVTIPERVHDKAVLIEIARKLKAENNRSGKFVCWFEIQIHAQSGAWAACAYLPECETCETEKDADGVAVECRIIGMPRSLADSLQGLHLDTISSKELVGAYLDDSWRCKTEIYRVNNTSSKLLLVQLYTGGGHLLSGMTLKIVNGEKRYYFDDEDGDDPGYALIDEAAKTIRFITAAGTVRQANVFL